MIATTNGAGNENNPEDNPDVHTSVLQPMSSKDIFEQLSESFCKLFESNFREDIDPLRDEAANIGRVASLGIEDTSDVEDIVRQIDGEDNFDATVWDEFDLDDDEESRQYDFNAEDIGLFITRNEYQLTTEQAWLGCVLHHEQMHKIQDKLMTGRNYEMAIESMGAIDRLTAENMKADFPCMFENVNLKSFTQRPSLINYKLAREEMSTQQLAMTGAAAAGGVFLIYKLLSWGSNVLSNNPAATNSIRKNMKDVVSRGERIKQDSRNVQDILKEIENGDKKLSGLMREQNGQEIIRNLGSADLQKVLDVKWSAGKEFQPLCNGFLRNFIKDESGTDSARFGGALESLAEDLKKAIEYVMQYVETAANKGEGDAIDYEKIANDLDARMTFVNDFINKNGIDVPSDITNSERVRALSNWFTDNLAPSEDWKPDQSPSADMVAGFGTGAFEVFDTSFTNNMTKSKESLKQILAHNKANRKEQDNKNQSFKVVSDAYVVLNSLLRAIVMFRNWLGNMTTKQSTFMGNLLTLFNPA